MLARKLGSSGDLFKPTGSHESVASERVQCDSEAG